ncbi:AAA family ATPase [Candidatus Latescibacterota bacterium]
MRIKHITVTKLFGVFDHSIPVNMDDRITIIYGPNGLGKTLTLSLVNELFNPGFGDFFRIPFDEVSVDLDDDGTISVKKIKTADNKDRLIFEYDKPDSMIKTFQFDNITEKEANEPDWLSELKDSVHISFIHTERLRGFTGDDWQEIERTLVENFDKNKNKLDILVRIINSRFFHKRLDISKQEGIVITTSNGMTLDPDMLSSGEQHVVVLLHELLFRVEPDSLILIDEPELSLHILWQQQFLRDLQEIICLAGFDVLIATHSPQIIHDRWDLAVELKDSRS